MFGQTATSDIGNVMVHTTSYRGHTPEEIAERALAKIISVGGQCDPVLRDQALAFKSYINNVLITYLREAQREERTTICGKLILNGQADLADIIQRL
tara:strand:- start:550 stop:840 length:291 start_codon:yes stop_codon:yes gene_type:complete